MNGPAAVNLQADLNPVAYTDDIALEGAPFQPAAQATSDNFIL